MSMSSMTFALLELKQSTNDYGNKMCVCIIITLRVCKNDNALHLT